MDSHECMADLATGITFREDVTQGLTRRRVGYEDLVLDEARRPVGQAPIGHVVEQEGEGHV